MTNRILAAWLCRNGRHYYETNPRDAGQLMVGWRRCYRCGVWQQHRTGHSNGVEHEWWEFAEPAHVEEQRIEEEHVEYLERDDGTLMPVTMSRNKEAVVDVLKARSVSRSEIDAHPTRSLSPRDYL